MNYRFYLFFTCGAAFFSLQSSHTLLRTAQGVGSGAGVLQMLAELQALRTEGAIVNSRRRAQGIADKMSEKGIDPTAYERYLRLAREYQEAASKKVRRYQAAADMFGAAQEMGHIRNNWFEAGTGAAAAVAGINARRDDQLGKRLPLRYLLAVLDGSIGLARQWWYRSPQQLRWLSATHATTGLLKMLARHGVKKVNKRVWLAYALQLVRAGLSFAGGPREYKELDGHRLPEPVPNATPQREFLAVGPDGFFIDRRGRELEHVVIGNRCYYPALIRTKLRTEPGPEDVEPDWAALRARAEGLVGEPGQVAQALIDRHERLWQDGGVLPRAGRYGGLALDYAHFDDDGSLRDKDGQIVDLAEFIAYRPRKVEPQWGRLRADAREILRAAPRTTVLTALDKGEELWREATERVTEIKINDEGQLADGNGTPLNAVEVGGRQFFRALAYKKDTPVPNWQALKDQATALADEAHKAHALAIIKRHENLWRIQVTLGKHRPAAPDSGGEYYFDDAGNLMTPRGALVAPKDAVLAPPARGRADEPNWQHLQRQARHILDPAIQQKVLQQLAQYQVAWQEYRRGYDTQVLISPEGTVVNALDEQYEMVEIGGRQFYPVLAYESGKQEPDWKGLREDCEKLPPAEQLRTSALYRRHKRLWDSKQLLESVRESADEYFDDVGHLRNPDGSIKVRLNPGAGYGDFVPGGDHAEPDWSVLRGKARDSLNVWEIRKHLSTCQRAWDAFLRRAGTTPGDNLTFDENGDLQDTDIDYRAARQLHAEQRAGRALLRERDPARFQGLGYYYRNQNGIDYIGGQMDNDEVGMITAGHLAPLTPGVWGVSQRPNFELLRERADRLSNSEARDRAHAIIARHEPLWADLEIRTRVDALMNELVVRMRDADVARRAAADDSIPERCIGEGEECPVCFENWTESRRYGVAHNNGSCTAIFHQACREAWPGSCPVCRDENGEGSLDQFVVPQEDDDS